MTIKRATIILTILFVMQMFWITGLILLGDVYTDYTTAKEVFQIKSVINGFACFMGLFLYVINFDNFQE